MLSTSIAIKVAVLYTQTKVYRHSNTFHAHATMSYALLLVGETTAAMLLIATIALTGIANVSTLRTNRYVPMCSNTFKCVPSPVASRQCRHGIRDEPAAL